jgi:hypothetical protein
LRKKKQVDDVEVFAGDFTEGFIPRSSYSDVTPSPIESPTKIFLSVIPSVKVNISPHYRPSSPLSYFSFFFPHPCI